MNDAFEIHFTIDRKTYAAVIRKRLFRSKRILLGFVLAVTSGGLFYFADVGNFGLVVTGALFFVIILRCWVAPTRWLSTAPYLSEQRTIRVTPERLFLETPSVKSEFPWNYYIAWNESPDYFMLDLTVDGYCSLIPKSAMTAEQEDLFRNWASAKIPKYPKKLKRK